MIRLKTKLKRYLRLVCFFLFVCMLLYSYSTSNGICGKMKTLLISSDWTQSKMYLNGKKYGEYYFARVIWESRNKLSLVNQPQIESARSVQLGPPIQGGIDSGLGRNVKMIMLWTPLYGETDWAPKVLCQGQEKTCVTTSNRDNLLKSDALIMHSMDFRFSEFDLPNPRLPSQRWIYFVTEPLQLSAQGSIGSFNIKDYRYVFNWTMSYRHDADIPFFFYRSEPLKHPLAPEQYNSAFAKIISTKRRLVFAAINNCDSTHNNRMEVIEELQNYIDVDFYGKCGDMVCPKASGDCTELFSQYKFVLAFENRNCRDYITGKVQGALHVYNAVPIVMGGSHQNDYIKIMPPNSYINSQGFASIKELAYFILFLDENVQFYERYHLWRQSHGQKSTDQWCHLCKAVHNSSSLPSKVYTNFDYWYSQDMCH